MQALVVYCHPNPQSFTAAVRDTVIARLEAAGAEVRLFDLYAQGFDPRLTAVDFDAYEDEASNCTGIEDEVAALRWCDTLIFVYPTWWYGLPAMLKGWLDRVLVPGVAFAMPGPFNYKKGIALYPEGFKYGELHGIHIESALQSILEEKLPMRFLNDATSFAVGEAWLSHNGMKEKQLCITLGTGLGAGFTRKGIPVVHDASVPPEGSLWNLPYREGIADDYFSTRGFITAYQNLTGIEVNGVRELANHYETDSHAKQVFDAFGENLGNFLSPWLKRFDADTLIIGGNIAKAYAHFENTLENTMKAHGLKLSVRIAKHSEKGAIIGSTLLFNEVFWNKVKKALPKY